MSNGVNHKSVAIVAVHPQTTSDPLVGPVKTFELLSTQAECLEAPACGQCWWDIHAVANELWIDNKFGGATLPNYGTFTRGARPRSALKHKVQWSVIGGGRFLFFDLNGQRTAVAGTTIQTSVVAPDGSISASRYEELTDLLRSNMLPTGIVSITVVEAWAYQTVGPIGGREGRFTSRVLVPSGGPPTSIFVPPGATDIHITGDDALAWEWIDRTPIFAGVVVGRVNAPLGESASIPVPGNATQIRPSALPPADAVYSLCWTLRF